MPATASDNASLLSHQSSAISRPTTLQSLQSSRGQQVFTLDTFSSKDFIVKDFIEGLSDSAVNARRSAQTTVTSNEESHNMETSVNNFPALLHDSQKPELPATPTAPPPAYRRRLWSTATTVSEVDGIDTMLTSRLDCLQEELNEAPDKVTPHEPRMPPVELEGSSLSPAELDAGFEGSGLAEERSIVDIALTRDLDETRTIKGHETESFASPILGGLAYDHDEPVGPLVSRSASRASSTLDGVAS